jgi:hypothetical protein
VGIGKTRWGSARILPNSSVTNGRSGMRRSCGRKSCGEWHKKRGSGRKNWDGSHAVLQVTIGEDEPHRAGNCAASASECMDDFAWYEGATDILGVDSYAFSNWSTHSLQHSRANVAPTDPNRRSDMVAKFRALAATYGRAGTREFSRRKTNLCVTQIHDGRNYKMNEAASEPPYAVMHSPQSSPAARTCCSTASLTSSAAPGCKQR